MPVQYGSIVAEHRPRAQAAALFDVSHMGRLRFDGPGAEAFLERIVTRRIAGMKPGQVRYALVTNDKGGILDDVLVYRLVDSKTGATYYQMVVNASNREKILVWLEKRRAAGFGPGGPEIAAPRDLTFDTAMIAVQGPKAAALWSSRWSAQPALALRVLQRGRNAAGRLSRRADGAGQPHRLHRRRWLGAGGAGPAGASKSGGGCWKSASPLGAQAGRLGGPRHAAAGSGDAAVWPRVVANRSIRFRPGLDFAVQLEGRDFPGHAALEKARREPSRLIRVGWKLAGKRVPRENYRGLVGRRRTRSAT